MGDCLAKELSNGICVLLEARWLVGWLGSEKSPQHFQSVDCRLKTILIINSGLEFRPEQVKEWIQLELYCQGKLSQGLSHSDFHLKIFHFYLLDQLSYNCFGHFSDLASITAGSH